MKKRLRDNVSSRYVEAANLLKPKGAPRRVVAYVESYDDVSFWRSVLDDFETPGLRFSVMLPSRTTLGRGKKNVLANELGKGLGQYMIACVDADYDYLLQGQGETSRMMLSCPYVFHTYVYAIESYQCYAEGLKEACVMATLNDSVPLDLAAFIREYSRIIWPLLVWNVWCYRNGQQHGFSLMDFTNVVTFRDVSPQHPEKTLEFVRRQVNRSVATMQRKHPEGKKTYVPLRDELQRLGLTAETAYMYMQGHRLMEGVVLPLVEPVCAQLRREREGEIKRLACHDTQRQNELSCYRRSQTPVDLMLKKSTAFKRSAPYQRLARDLAEFVGSLTPTPATPGEDQP
ncbi:MAG: DUF4435 domain-containing protein [Prevotellaceae bacterium]|nr:DUF4435 domain-containing protein [Prevotellaceae bacterium]